MRLALLLPLLVTSFALPALPGATRALRESPDDEAAVRKLVTDFSAAFDRSDAVKYKALHAANVVVVDLGVVSRNRDELVNHFVEDLGGAYKGFRIVSFKVEIFRFLNATTAVLTVPWEFSLPGQPNVKGIALMVAGKHGSQWLLDAWQSAALQP